jgi:hypothetical protein
MLRQLVEAERQEAIDLSNRVTIEVHTASFRTTRGYTIVAALLDEIAFWPTDPDSADPDAEVVSAIKPSMATIPEGKKWILDNQVVPNQVGLGLVEELRSYLDGLPARQLADTLIGGLSTYDFPETHGGEMPMRRLRASLPLKRRWCQSSPRRLKGIIQIPRSWSS